MNQFIGIGNITKDLDLRSTASGKSVCSFSIAINHGFGDKKQTDYIDCVAWDKAAESLCKYMSKGKKIAVSGRLQKRSYEDAKGNTRYVTEVVVDEVEFLSPMGEKPNMDDRDREPDDMEPVDGSPDDPF